MKTKMKTKKAISKRVKVTGTGKWKSASAYTSHLALNKSTKQKRQARKLSIVDTSDQKRMERALPYSKKSK